ncbi:MAG TPA: DUF4829 domain-containing protein [Clostridiales bacterium]|nr:DUF4829 domain-containing protein [Clostridiales bacterium]
MSKWFIEILNMSISAGYVALIVIVIRLALKKAPKIYSYALWAVVFFRLICPFTIQLPVSAVPVQPQTIPQDIVYSGQPSINSGVPAIDRTVNNAIETSLPPVNPVSSVNPIQILLELGAVLWLAGVLVLLLYGIISYLHLKRRIMTAIRIKDNIYETDLIKTPFVLGFIRIRIYVPTGLGENELEYVVAHEQAHIRRRDHLIKPLAFLVTALHWFNPLVWLSYGLMVKDMELSADESVMKGYASDVRSDYASSLLALSVKRSGLLSPLAFGETGVKERVKNVLHYKKPRFWVSVMAIIIVATVSLVLIISRQTEITPADQNIPGSQSDTPIWEASDSSVTPEAAYTTEYDTVKISLLSGNKGFASSDIFETTDLQAVSYIDRSIRESKASDYKDDLENNHTNQYQIEVSNRTGGYSCQLYYDTLYEKAYIGRDGGLSDIGTDFARYVDSLLEHADITFDIAGRDAAALFKAYGWTLDYQINGMKNKLGDINTLSDFQPNPYYFAYHNELSKDIGLDMSPYSNTADLDIEIYKVHESLPQKFYPIQDCRGIAVKSGGKIIGAFISAGRHSTFNACSLKGNSFEEVTGQTVNGWLADKVKRGAEEEKLSLLEPEQIIEEYFRALDKEDSVTAKYCMSKKTLLDNLSVNMRDEELFNEGVELPFINAVMGSTKSNFNLKSAKLSKVEPVGEPDKDTKTFRVYVDLQYEKEQTMNNGEQFWDCSMVYESPQTGWKIEGFGH